MIIVGMLPFRVAGFLCGVLGLISSGALIVLIEAYNTWSDYVGVGVMVAVLALGSAYFIAKSLEYIAITEQALEVHRIGRKTNLLFWHEIVDVTIVHDPYTVLPKVQLSDDQSVKLRGAASFGMGPRSACARTMSQIKARIG